MVYGLWTEMGLGVGVELSPSAIQVAVVSGPKPLRLLAAREIPCDSADGGVLTRTLVQLRSSLRIRHPIIVGLPSTSTILTTVKPLVVSPQRALLAVEFELRQHLPFELAEATWHCHWLSGPNGHPRGFRISDFGFRIGGVSNPQSAIHNPQLPLVVVAAMKHSLLNERLACFRRAGLSVGAVSVSAVAMLNAWSLSHAKPSPPSVALLHLLNEQTAEWVLWSPTGLQIVPVAISSAETCWQELAASWEALHAQFPDVPRQVWLVGPSTALGQVQSSLAGQGGTQVEWFDLARAAAVTTGASRLEHPERSVAALGLALQGLGAARLPLNLLAGAQREGRHRQAQRRTMLINGSCVVAMLALGVGGMAEVGRRHRLVLESIERQERLYRTLRSEIRALLQRQERLQERHHQLERVVGDARVVAQVLGRITEALPEEVWLTKLECARGGAAIDGVLEGRAKSFQQVTQLLDQLKSVAGMTSVKPLSTTVITDPGTGKEVVAFAVQLQRSVQESVNGTSP
ncbi:MAG: PilN domain-containing protein [Candidatus Omnitrophota bacterium]|nr:PilN domain-containing protein [Candidatus Omnitrophota bacterium]